ncbi:MAG TPA: M20/M25/M40 family metallo-hydrolase [Pyrinomonadaceae bacterium]|nr:M20/M25/M40 family metallo-hydrolase [Pyrinomonadaceae bacterium]
MRMNQTRIRLILLLIGVLLLCQLTAAQKLSTDEQKIISYIDAHLGDAISLIQRSVDIESPTEDLAGVKAVGMLYAKELEAAGLRVKWIDMPAEAKRAGHLVAETGGTRGKRLLLLGHLDTVLRGEKFRREGDRVFGTGVGDMKGGNVLAITALKALHAAGVLKDTRIIVMFTGDEEDSCEPVAVCRGDMIAAAKRSDAALSFESTILNTATVGRRGSSSWTLEVEAKTGHSSQIFRDGMGNGAIFEASRIINEFREKLSGEKYLTFNPALFVGGTTVSVTDSDGMASGKTNVVPAKVVIKGDLRFISEAQKESARNRMREIVGKSLAGAKAKITFQDGIPAMTPVEGNYALLKQLDQVSRDLGYGTIEALDPGDRGAGDVAYVSNLLPALDGIGIGGSQNSHAKGESASVENFAMLTKRAALLIYRLTRE